MGDILDTYILKNKYKKSNILFGSIFLFSLITIIALLFYVYSFFINNSNDSKILLILAFKNVSITILWVLTATSIVWIRNNYDLLKQQCKEQKNIVFIVYFLIFSTFTYQFLTNEITDGFAYVNENFKFTNKTTINVFLLELKSSSVNFLSAYITDLYHIVQSVFAQFFGFKIFFEQRVFFHFVYASINIYSLLELFEMYLDKFNKNKNYIWLSLFLPLIVTSWDISKLIWLPMFPSWNTQNIILPLVFLLTWKRKFIYSLVVILLFTGLYMNYYKGVKILFLILIIYKIYDILLNYLKSKNSNKKINYEFFIQIFIIIGIWIINIVTPFFVKMGPFFQKCQHVLADSYDTGCTELELTNLVKLQHIYEYYFLLLYYIIFIKNNFLLS